MQQLYESKYHPIKDRSCVHMSRAGKVLRVHTHTLFATQSLSYIIHLFLSLLFLF